MRRRLLSNGVVAALLLLLPLAGVCGSCVSNAVSGVGGVADTGGASRNRSGRGQAQSPLPPPTGFVNDYANAFSPESKGRLESVLTELRDKSDIEFAVVTVETTGGQPISDYSLAVAKGWGVGPKDTSKGGGLLLLLSVKDRLWRLQVSRSLEKDLPDRVCEELGERSVELYRQGKYAEGVTKYVKAIIARLEEIRGFKLSDGGVNPPAPRAVDAPPRP